MEITWPGLAIPGMGSKSVALAQLNTVLLAPMPRVSVSTATMVTPGFLRSMRSPYRRSWRRECIGNLTAANAAQETYGALPYITHDGVNMFTGISFLTSKPAP